MKYSLYTIILFAFCALPCNTVRPLDKSDKNTTLPVYPANVPAPRIGKIKPRKPSLRTSEYTTAYEGNTHVLSRADDYESAYFADNAHPYMWEGSRLQSRNWSTYSAHLDEATKDYTIAQSTFNRVTDKLLIKSLNHTCKMIKHACYDIPGIEKDLKRLDELHVEWLPASQWLYRSPEETKIAQQKVDSMSYFVVFDKIYAQCPLLKSVLYEQQLKPDNELKKRRFKREITVEPLRDNYQAKRRIYNELRK